MQSALVWPNSINCEAESVGAAVNRFAYENGGYKPDYVTLKKDALILTLVWATIVGAAIGRVIFSLTTGTYFWGFLF